MLVVASPFGMLLLPGSIGRYDAVGVIAAAVVALLPLAGRLPPWPVAVVLALVVLAACASEEFLGAYLVPVALAAAVRLGRGHTGRTAAMAVVVLAPGAVVAVVGVLSPPEPASSSARRCARGEGGRAGRGPVPDQRRDGARQHPRDQLALFADFDPGALIGLPVAFGACSPRSPRRSGCWSAARSRGRRWPPASGSRSWRSR